MLESSKDPWDWLGGFFTVPGVKRAPRGIEDPVITRVKLQDLGRSNVEECELHGFGCELGIFKLTLLETYSRSISHVQSFFILHQTKIARTRSVVAPARLQNTC